MLKDNHSTEISPKETSKSYTFDDYRLDVNSSDSIDALIIRGRLLHAKATLEQSNSQDVTVIQHHVLSSLDDIISLDEGGYFEARLRKDDDYILRFSTSKEVYAVALKN